MRLWCGIPRERAAQAASFFPDCGASTGLLRMPSPNGTRAPTAAFHGFRSHRLRATTHERRSDIGRHRAHHQPHLIRGHETRPGLTAAQGKKRAAFAVLARVAAPQPPPRPVRPR